MRSGDLVNVPLHSISNEHSLEKPKMNGVISDGIRRTPHMEGADMISGVLSKITFKLGNV